MTREQITKVNAVAANGRNGSTAGAGAQSGLRVALIGKGGSGKSAIAGTLCRVLGRSGWPVLAIDLDVVPGLSLSLGLGEIDGRLPAGLGQMVDGPKGKRWKMNKGAGAAHLVDTLVAVGPDGVRYLEAGKYPGRFEPESAYAFWHVLQRFRRPTWAMVGDVAGGTRWAYSPSSSFATIRIAVVEPSAKGVMTAERLASVATHLVVNKVRNDGDMEMVRDGVALPIIAAIPYDDTFAQAERQGHSPIDVDPDSPAVRAVGDLATWLGEHR